MTAKNVFISSVRRGLEEERDSAPALVQAIGHSPSRFEDFSAQPTPSRDACLAGVEAADVYVLLLAEHYGDPLTDSGLSPTEEEWTVAKRRGIPILVFRKSEIEMEPLQREFVSRVEDYVTGRFRGTFTNSTDLLPKLAAILRELDLQAAPLVWTALGTPVVPEWVIAERGSQYGVSATVELHLIPTGGGLRISALELERLPDRIARVGRDYGFFGGGDALDLSADENRATAVQAQRDRAACGTSVHADGAVSVWAELPHDNLGTILDRSDVTSRVVDLVRLGSEFLTDADNQVAIALGLGPLQMAMEGSISDLGRRTSATMGMRDGVTRLDPDQSVPASALAAGTNEIAAELAARLFMRLGER